MYASVIFLHSNYKNLSDEGFDPKAIGDPLYFRDDVAGRYVELDEHLHAELSSGRLRL